MPCCGLQVERLLRVHRCRGTAELLAAAERAEEQLAQYEEMAEHAVGGSSSAEWGLGSLLRKLLKPRSDCESYINLNTPETVSSPTSHTSAELDLVLFIHTHTHHSEQQITALDYSC